MRNFASSKRAHAGFSLSVLLQKFITFSMNLRFQSHWFKALIPLTAAIRRVIFRVIDQELHIATGEVKT
jgi:hypothetical protein